MILGIIVGSAVTYLAYRHHTTKPQPATYWSPLPRLPK